MGRRTDEEPSSLVLADDGADLKVSAISYGAVADLCVDVLEIPNAACATLTAMTVPSGQGQSSWKPLLAEVQPDRREFPSNMLQEHMRAVRTVAIGVGAALTLLLALFASMLANLL